MYRAFIDGGWIWMLAEGYITDGQEVVYTRLCCDFVQGLNSMSSALTREFFDYCQQQPRDFLVMFFMVTANLRGPDGKFLLALCPRNSSEWVTHHTTLEGIMDWCQAPNRDDLPFPLDNLFNGKVVQSPDGREVSLDEALRMNITRDYTVFEWAARTILLGEAAPDPPDFPE
ncbi:hypothetical protein CPB85DRAFT_597686 [Mucidula mucida]|nr:hypothetical protein CPB85DRAFT_597686 [Mucidula mucida]